MTGASLGDFLLNGVEDLEAALDGLEVPEADRAYWMAENAVYREAARRIYAASERLHRLCTGRAIDQDARWFYRDFFDRPHVDEYEMDETVERHPAGARWPDPRSLDPMIERLETSLAESAAEAEQRRFTERER